MTMILLVGVSKTVYKIRPVIRTIISAYLLARFCESVDLWCKLDIFTVYFLIGQFMFFIIRWEFQQLPLLSLTFYQGWLCMSVAFETFFVYDIMFRYLSRQLNFLFFWISSIVDM
jgi:hypothetical protein